MSEPRRHLLIVEDDPALQKQMCWAFDQYDTIVADDRESAVASVRRYEPPVVTMDLGLPPRPDESEKKERRAEKARRGKGKDKSAEKAADEQ